MKWGIMLCCLFLLSGCGTKKHSYRSETMSMAVSSQKDSSHVVESVQRVITELIECKGTALITVTELSMPDSIGNQYIVKTTQADIHSERKRSVTTEENGDKQEVETSVKVKDERTNEVITDNLQVERKFILPGWVYGVLFILLGCIGVWIAKKFKK